MHLRRTAPQIDNSETKMSLLLRTARSLVRNPRGAFASNVSCWTNQLGYDVLARTTSNETKLSTRTLVMSSVASAMDICKTTPQYARCNAFFELRLTQAPIMSRDPCVHVSLHEKLEPKYCKQIGGAARAHHILCNPHLSHLL